MQQRVRAFLVVAFLAATIAVAIAFAETQPPDVLAMPTPVSVEEMEVVAAVFLVFFLVMQPAREALERDTSAVSGLLRTRLDLPKGLKVAAVVVFVWGSFAFAFWSIADVLGGYMGYGYSFSTYPILAAIYNNSIGLVPFLSARDKGTQASFYLALALLALVALRMDRGLGTALKDTMTLFAAPIVVVFELGVWYFAPEDMTWHVTDYLWIGGVNDGGWRIYDFGSSYGNVVLGDYLVSNFLVLFVALVLVASRIPSLSLPSKVLWRRVRGLRRDVPLGGLRETRAK